MKEGASAKSTFINSHQSKYLTIEITDTREPYKLNNLQKKKGQEQYINSCKFLIT